MNNKQKELHRKNNQQESAAASRESQEFVYNPDLEKRIGKRTGNLYTRVNPKHNFDGFPRFSEYESHRNTESSSLAKQLENTSQPSINNAYLQGPTIQNQQINEPSQPFIAKQSPIIIPLDSHSSSRVPNVPLPRFGQFAISSIKKRNSAIRPSQVKSYRDLLNELQSQEFKQFIFNQQEIEHIEESAKKQSRRQVEQDKKMKKKGRQSRVSFKQNPVEREIQEAQIVEVTKIQKQKVVVIVQKKMNSNEKQQQKKKLEEKKKRQAQKERQNKIRNQQIEKQIMNKKEKEKEEQKRKQQQAEKEKIRQQQRQRQRDRERLQRQIQRQKQRQVEKQKEKEKQRKIEKQKKEQKQRQLRAKRQAQQRQEERKKEEEREYKYLAERENEKKRERQQKRRKQKNRQKKLDRACSLETEQKTSKQSQSSNLHYQQQFEYQSNQYLEKQSSKTDLGAHQSSQTTKDIEVNKKVQPRNQRKKKQIRVTDSPEAEQNSLTNKIGNNKQSASTSNSAVNLQSQSLVHKKSKVRVKSKQKLVIPQLDSARMETEEQSGRYPKRIRIKPVQYWENQRVHYKAGVAVGIQRAALDIKQVLNLKEYFDNIINLNLHTQDVEIQLTIPPKKSLESKGLRQPYTKMIIKAGQKWQKEDKEVYFDDGIRSESIEPKKIIEVEPFREFEITNNKKTPVLLQIRLQVN